MTENLTEFFYVVKGETPADSVLKLNIRAILEDRGPIIKENTWHNEMPYQMIERFIPQIVEELYEFQSEISPSTLTLTNAAKYELSDIILYIGSVLTELIKNFGVGSNTNLEMYLNYIESTHYIQLKLEDPDSVYKIGAATLPDQSTEYFIRKSDRDKVITTTGHLGFILGKVRSEFPARKYHKPLKYGDMAVNMLKDLSGGGPSEHTFITLYNTLLVLAELYMDCYLSIYRAPFTLPQSRGLVDKAVDSLNYTVSSKSYNPSLG